MGISSTIKTDALINLQVLIERYDDAISNYNIETNENEFKVTITPITNIYGNDFLELCYTCKDLFEGFTFKIEDNTFFIQGACFSFTYTNPEKKEGESKWRKYNTQPQTDSKNF